MFTAASGWTRSLLLGFRDSNVISNEVTWERRLSGIRHLGASVQSRLSGKCVTHASVSMELETCRVNESDHPHTV